jgi:hypothetical protein
MGKRMILGTILAAAALWAAPQTEDRRVLIDHGRLLEAELALVKTNKSYFFVDLEAKRVELRIQGVLLKTWNVAKYAQWGRPLPSGSFKLVKKEALRTPRRTNITPDPDKEKRNKAKSSEPEVLELKDMPDRFSFEFENGITIRFKSRTRKIFPRLGIFFGSIGRAIYLPLKTIWAAVRRADFTDIQITAQSKGDAQGIYWTAQEGMSVLVFHKLK